MMKAIDAKTGVSAYRKNYLFGEKISLDGEVLPPLIPDVDTLLRFVAITNSVEDPMTQKEKLSKSKSNSKMEPTKLLNTYGADVIRYLAASGRLGQDVIMSEETFERGKKLINKIWNVSKFIEMHLEDYKDTELNDFEYIDKWIINEFKCMEKSFIKYLDNYEMGLALNTLEKFFWNFCDNYIEIVKHRLYRPEEFGTTQRYNGQKTIYILLYKLLQDFSMFFPYITEEIYQELYKDNKSIHITNVKELSYKFDKENIYGNIIIDIISEVRKFKTQNNCSLKTPISLDISLDEELTEAINSCLKDFKATLTIQELKITSKEKGYKINNITII